MNAFFEVIQFVYSLLGTIVEGIYGIVSIINAIFTLVNNMIAILPNPLYNCLLFFISLYLIIFVYKIFRKG